MLALIDKKQLKSWMVEQARNYDPYALYASMFYGPAQQNHMKCFRMTFPHAPQDKINTSYILAFQNSLPVMKALKELSEQIVGHLNPEQLVMRLIKIMDDENEANAVKIKAIEQSAKLMKFYQEKSININIQELELIIPEFEQDVIDITQVQTSKQDVIEVVFEPEEND